MIKRPLTSVKKVKLRYENLMFEPAVRRGCSVKLNSNVSFSKILKKKSSSRFNQILKKLSQNARTRSHKVGLTRNKGVRHLQA